MSFDVSVAGTAIPTDVSTLKSLPGDKDLAFELDATLNLLLNATLAQVPSDKAKSSVSYKSPAISLPPLGPVTYGWAGDSDAEVDSAFPEQRLCEAHVEFERVWQCECELVQRSIRGEVIP
jgi:hypothetical protein